MDDARFFQLLEVHKWDEDERLLPVQYAAIQLTVNLDPYWSRAVTALRSDRYGERLVSQVPLHEGHSEGVDRSGRVGLLARAEPGVMRSFFYRHRIRPRHCFAVTPEQERKVLLEFIENGPDSRETEIECLCNSRRRKWHASSR